MQTVLTYLTLLFTTVFLQAQNTIEVTMTGFDNNKGSVQVGLYDKESNFLDKEYKTIASKIEGGTATVTFTEVPDGVYAISCYHDEDSNGKLNMFMGMIPREPYGTSNNAPSNFGPPKWEDAKFEVKEGEKVSFKIKL